MAILGTSCASSYFDKKQTSFANAEIDYAPGFGNIVEIIKAYMADKRTAAVPKHDIAVQKLTGQSLMNESDDVVYRLGHSTILMKIDGQYVLTDPVFSDRASPVQWAGPKRFHQPPISMADLPQITAVLISHDHYDHLDKASIIALKDKVDHFYTPSSVKKLLVDWGVSPDKVTELNWWQSVQHGSLEFVATPTQHFSGRGVFDRNKTLWASWVVLGKQSRVYFSGDSGYFSGFKEIGEKYGPFDITLVETGAYNELWKDIHMMPEESLQAHKDLKGKYMMPIHNGTFDLALHEWFEPLEQITELAARDNVQLLTPQFGEKITVSTPENTIAWWLLQQGELDVALVTD